MTDGEKKTPSVDGHLDILKAINALGKMFAVIAPDRKILSASTNDAFSETGDMAGKPCYAVFFKRDAPCENCGLETVLKQGRPIVTPRRDGTPGTQGLLHNYIYPLYKGEAIESLVCLGLELPVKDVPIRMTELSKSFLFNLIHSAADGVIAADKKGNIRVFNETASRIFDYKASEALTDLNICDLYPGGGAHQVMEKLRSPEYGGKGKLFGYQTNGLGNDGNTIPLRINASIVYEETREIATIGFFHDMREELCLQEKMDETGGQKPDAAGQACLGDFINGLTRQFTAYDIQFCEAVIDKDLAPKARVDCAQRKQKEIWDKTKIHVPVGRVMIQLGIITEDQRNDLLATSTVKSTSDSGKETASEDLKIQESPSIKGSEPSAEVDPESNGEAFEITVSEDKLTVYCSPEGKNSETMSPDHIRILMADKGITYGILDASEIEQQVAAAGESQEPLIFARGRAPEPGRPLEVKFLFESDPLRIGTVRENGTTDWKDRGELAQVKKGDLLAEIIPATEGLPGMDVFGAAIAPPPASKFVPKCGKGTTQSEDGKHYVATQDGMVTMAANGALTVAQEMRIDGDIGLETGHVSFEGHIEVTGSIQKGYRVSGHSLRAGDIHGAEVHVAGNMVVMGGIYESDIKCKDTLKVSHIHKSSIAAGDNLIVEREIFESNIETGGRCLMGAGNIVASEIAAKKGIQVKNVGTEASKPSTLVVGIDHRRNLEVKNIRNKTSVLSKEKQRLAADIEALKRRGEKVNTALGEAAQEQDRHMVETRDLETQRDDPSVKNDNTKFKKIEKQLATLCSLNEQQDTVVDDLMAQDEEISEKLSALTSDLESTSHGLEQLDKEMKSLVTAMAEDPGIATVKVSGILTPRTTINGPKTTLTIREELRSVQIIETDKPDAEERRKWRLEVMKLR
ncbi:MAG: DUF342 domain-containing protein [Desulfobacterales bacterium]|nr:DUF342 domain-containing protein [Desulfobacterales bacterium]